VLDLEDDMEVNGGWYPVLDVGREAWGVVLESPLVVQFLFGAGSALCG